MELGTEPTGHARALSPESEDNLFMTLPETSLLLLLAGNCFEQLIFSHDLSTATQEQYS